MTDITPPSEPRSNLPVAAQPGYGSRALGRPSVGMGLPPEARDGDPPIPWRQFLDGLVRRWWIIVIVTVVGSVGGWYYSQGIRPEYTVQVRIMDQGAKGTPIASPIRTQQVLSSTSWRDLLTTSAVIDPVVRQLSLNVTYDDPTDSALFRGFQQDSAVSNGRYRLIVDSAGTGYTLVAPVHGATERGAVGDSIGRQFGLRWAPAASLLTPNRVVIFEVWTPRGAASSLSARVNIRPTSEDGQFLIMQLRGPDRSITAAINAWADQLVIAQTAVKRMQYTNQQSVLENQLSLAQQKVQQDEQRLLAFNRSTSTLPFDNAQATGTGTFFNLQLSLSSVRADRLAMEDLLKQGDSLRPEAILNVASVYTSNPLLRSAVDSMHFALAALEDANRRYQPGTEPVVKAETKVRDARANMFRLARTSIDALQLQETTLATKLKADSNKMQDIPQRQIDSYNLNKNVSSSRQLYDMINNSYQQMRLTAIQTQPDLIVIQYAYPPQQPSSDQGPRIRLLAIIASLAAGLALALLVDRLDHKFRYPEQATMELGLSIAGTIPKFRVNRKGQLGLETMSQVVEAFRSLRLGVRYHFADDEPVVVAISSPGAAEGKSLVSSNLAVAFANAGHKTLLIDGDLRRGVVHTTFGIPRRPGLADHLDGLAASDTIVHPTTTENLSVIPSGVRTRRAPELLVSDRMQTIVAALRRDFEVIIIDGPPFAAGMDAYALGNAAGAMLIVLRPGVSDRKLTAAKLEILDRLPIRPLGAVLNGITGRGAYRYYYSDYSEYDIEEDEDAVARRESGNQNTPRLPSKR